MGTSVSVGIDLGTTNSTAAVFDGSTVSLVRSRSGGTLTPSVVRFDARGNVTVGDRARRFLDSDPDNTRAEFKRLMGTDQTLEFKAAKLKKKPEELAAEVLRALRDDLATQLGFAPEQAVISVPALFELPQIAATSEAARLAGFSRIEVIQEPVASAIAAGWSAEAPGRHWLVYDLGGGTFDVSLMETSEGLLRVVGHDGDNFLGGRDFDAAIVAWVLGRLKETGVHIDRADPAHAAALRRLRWAAEEAKIDLSLRPRASLSLPGLFTVDGEPVDVDEELDLATFEALVLPLIERSLAVCLRLLHTHGLAPNDLDHVVLIGGPTAMPALRARVLATLPAPVATQVDPMTAVAQGAALFATTAGLLAQPAAPPPKTAGPGVWLQHPAVTADVAPFVVGRVLQPEGLIGIRVVRADGGWTSDDEALDKEHTFALPVAMVVRQVNEFNILGLRAGADPIPLSPPTFRIVHGLTVGDPPLARTVGVARADDTVQVFVERGAPLPMRRTFTLRTVAVAAPGSGDALRVPIVQGEFSQAHLCRLVGTLVIENAALKGVLPAGSEVEITLELDRGGRLSARGLVPALGQTFEHVAQLIVPHLSVEATLTALAALSKRLGSVQRSAFEGGEFDNINRLGLLRAQVDAALGDLEAARGGDADAGEKARRLLLEVDGQLGEVEAARAWPVAEAEADHAIDWATGWIGHYGDENERKVFAGVTARIRQMITAKKPAELERELRTLRQLGWAAYYRWPQSWAQQFEHAASRVSEASDLVAGAEAVRAGKAALASGNRAGLEAACRSLWELYPPDEEDRRQSHDSGVR